MLTLLTGGARSGKSTAAVQLATSSDATVVYLATAQAGDAEMTDRIARHRADRPATWTTLESPRELAAALASTSAEATVIVDCLALWVTNLLDESDDEILARAGDVADLAAARPGTTIVVTNEVGSGIVPDNPLARRFRDVLGSVNQRFAAVADRSFLCVSGGLLALTPLGRIVEETTDV